MTSARTTGVSGRVPQRSLRYNQRASSRSGDLIANWLTMSRSSHRDLDEVESAVSASALHLGYPSLRPEQFAAAVAVVRGFDVFVCDDVNNWL